MRYKVILALLCTPLFAVQMHTAPSPKAGAQMPAKAPQIAAPMSEKVLYETLFNRMLNQESRAKKRESEGMDASAIRNKVFEDLALIQSEADILKSIAFDCYLETEELDRQATQIIKEARAMIPGGKLNGRPLPECPPILRIMQRQRDDAFLNARLRLKSELGASRFEVFESQLKFLLEKTVKSR